MVIFSDNGFTIKVDTDETSPIEVWQGMYDDLLDLLLTESVTGNKPRGLIIDLLKNMMPDIEVSEKMLS